MSDRAASCPQCGMTIADIKALLQKGDANEVQPPVGQGFDTTAERRRKAAPIWMYIVIGVIVAGIVAVAILFTRPQKDTLNVIKPDIVCEPTSVDYEITEAVC